MLKLFFYILCFVFATPKNKLNKSETLVCCLFWRDRKKTPWIKTDGTKGRWEMFLLHFEPADPFLSIWELTACHPWNTSFWAYTMALRQKYSVRKNTKPQTRRRQGHLWLFSLWRTMSPDGAANAFEQHTRQNSNDKYCHKDSSVLGTCNQSNLKHFEIDELWWPASAFSSQIDKFCPSTPPLELKPLINGAWMPGTLSTGIRSKI